MSSSPVHYSHRRAIATDQYRPSSSVPAVRSYRSSSKAPETSDGVVLELNPNTLIGYLGLPEASAALPPSLGIVHRFEHLPSFSPNKRPLKSSSKKNNVKYTCAVCRRKAACLCSCCASTRVDFHRKRSKQNELLRERDEIAHDIEQILRDETSMETSLVTIRESILNLKFAIENKRNSIAEKKKMLEKIDHKFMRSRKNTNHLQSLCHHHEEVLVRKSSASRMELEQFTIKLIKRQREMTLELMKDVYRLSQRLCKCSECVCNISNLQRQQQQSDLFSNNDDYRRRRIPEQIVDASRSSKDGKILVTPAVEDSSKPTIHYSINDHCLNDCCKSGLKRLLSRYFNTGGSKSYLKEPSVNSTNSIAFHSAMTALTYTIQLINVLQFIFDALLPARVSINELLLMDKMTQHDSFNVVIAKLRLSVVWLCLIQGIHPSTIDPKRPFVNLMALYQHIDSSNDYKMVSYPCIMPHKLREAIEEDLVKIQKPLQEDDGWCLVPNLDIETLKSFV